MATLSEWTAIHLLNIAWIAFLKNQIKIQDVVDDRTRVRAVKYHIK